MGDTVLYGCIHTCNLVNYCVGLNPALISIAKNISNTSSRSSLRLIWNWKRNLKSFNYDSTHYEALSSLGLWGWTVTRGGLERYFWVTGQGRKPRPGLSSLPWPAPLGPIHQSSQWKTFPGSKCKMVHCWEPQATEGHRVRGMISETLSFVLTSNLISKSFMMKCLRYFLLEI